MPTQLTLGPIQWKYSGPTRCVRSNKLTAGSNGGLRFKLAVVLDLPSNLALMTKDAGLRCGPDMFPLALGSVAAFAIRVNILEGG